MAPGGDTGDRGGVPAATPCSPPSVPQFQFVNSYLSLFYIGFYLKDMERLKEVRGRARGRRGRPEPPLASPGQTDGCPPPNPATVPPAPSRGAGVPACPRHGPWLLCSRPEAAPGPQLLLLLTVSLCLSVCLFFCPFHSSCSSSLSPKASCVSSKTLSFPPSSSTSTSLSSSLRASWAFAGDWEYPK